MVSPIFSLCVVRSGGAGFMFMFTMLMTLLGVFQRDLFPIALLRMAFICVVGGVTRAPLHGALMSGCIEGMSPARPNLSLDRTPCRQRLRATRSRPPSLVR